MSAPWGREGASNNAEKSRQGEGGGLAVSGHHFQCGLCKREKGIYRLFYRHLSSLKIEK